MDILYEDEIPIDEEGFAPIVSYAKYPGEGEIPDELEELFVEPSFRRGGVPDKTHRYLLALKDHFGAGRFVTYKQIMEWEEMKGKTRNSRGIMPWITIMLNKLYRAGKIRKFHVPAYRRVGLEDAIRTGKKYGITYKLSDAETGFDT